MTTADSRETENEMRKAREAMVKTGEKIAENLAGVNRKIAIMSGKGGVGKTTIAVNIAAFLAKEHKVSILDADVDCPNVNRFLGIKERFSARGNRIIPVEKFGMKVVSFASFQEREDQPIIWRGPMLSNALMQVLGQTEWGKLDYMIADLPPGTSDAPLTIMQMLRPDGMVIVTTPQAVAVTDAKKSANMAGRMGVPVLGVIENMSGKVFGSGGGERAARELGVDFLGRIRLDAGISGSAEKGIPLVTEKNGKTAGYREIERITERINQKLNDDGQ